MLSQLTYKIVAFKETPGVFDMNDCVDWALEMMELGYEGEHLYILAGLEKPVLYYYAIDYLRAAIKELNLRELEGEDAIISYAGYYISQLAKGENLRANLKILNDFCIYSNYESAIYDFYLLYWAWDDLDYWGIEQYHWEEGATKDNIESIVIERATQWLKDNKHIYDKLIQPAG